jgi:hypothetical protein
VVRPLLTLNKRNLDERVAALVETEGISRQNVRRVLTSLNGLNSETVRKIYRVWVNGVLNEVPKLYEFCKLLSTDFCADAYLDVLTGEACWPFVKLQYYKDLSNIAFRCSQYGLLHALGVSTIKLGDKSIDEAVARKDFGGVARALRCDWILAPNINTLLRWSAGFPRDGHVVVDAIVEKYRGEINPVELKKIIMSVKARRDKAPMRGRHHADNILTQLSALV